MWQFSYHNPLFPLSCTCTMHYSIIPWLEACCKELFCLTCHVIGVLVALHAAFGNVSYVRHLFCIFSHHVWLGEPLMQESHASHTLTLYGWQASMYLSALSNITELRSRNILLKKLQFTPQSCCIGKQRTRKWQVTWIHMVISGCTFLGWILTFYNFILTKKKNKKDETSPQRKLKLQGQDNLTALLKLQPIQVFWAFVEGRNTTLLLLLPAPPFCHSEWLKLNSVE